jgi:carbamoyl-phosphate synthase large subunit
MGKARILVLGAGGNVSIGILKAIRNSDISAHIFGACVQKYAAGFALCDESLLCPYANHESFLPWVKKVVEDNNINIVLSGVEEINNALAIAGILSDKCQLLVPEKHNLDIFSNKITTVNWLADNKIDHPQTLDLGEGYSFLQVESSLTLPFIVKPKIGKGSVNLFIIENEEQYLDIENINLYVAQQLVGDAESEYTCGVYKSKFGYTEIIVMRRLLRNGSTIMAEVVDNKLIHDYCKQIADACDTIVPFNIQLRLCKNTQKPLCFEVNMRLSGTTAIRHGFGFKDCQVWIKEAVQNKNFHNDFNVKPAIAIRYEAEVFLDKDTVNALNLIRPTAMVGN